MKIANRKSGVQGTSNSARNTGEVSSFCTASRSRCATAALPSFGTTAVRRTEAAKTRLSSRI